MKGFIRTAAIMCTAAVGGMGCYCYRDLVDPCYPQRYEYASRVEEKAAFAPQVQNGHVLDQTVWNYHFEPGTANLTAGGIDHLAYLARRRPQPDPLVFLQTAQDVTYDAKNPEKMVEERNDLDRQRVEAIQRFLGAQTAGRSCTFQVQIHDPAEVGMPAVPVDRIVHQMYESFRGRLGFGGASVSGGAGAFPTAGGTGGTR
jgi:hypothetical protein